MLSHLMTIKSYSSIMVSFAQDEEVEDIANILNLSLEEQTIQEPSKRKKRMDMSKHDGKRPPRVAKVTKRS